MTSGIYKLTNIINKKIYIGSAININRRWKSHKRSASQDNPIWLISRALKKYGIDAFDWQIIEEVPKESLLEREQYYLDILQPFGDFGYNTAHIAGSTLGVKFSEQTRNTMSEQRKGKAGIWNKGRIAWNHGLSWNEDVKQKISRTKLGSNTGINNHRSKPTTFISPNGAIVLFDSINSGCLKYNLNVSAMAAVARGIRNQHKGWRLAEEKK